MRKIADIKRIGEKRNIDSICTHPFRKREYYRDGVYKCCECLKIIVN